MCLISELIGRDPHRPRMSIPLSQRCMVHIPPLFISAKFLFINSPYFLAYSQSAVLSMLSSTQCSLYILCYSIGYKKSQRINEALFQSRQRVPRSQMPPPNATVSVRWSGETKLSSMKALFKCCENKYYRLSDAHRSLVVLASVETTS